MSRLQQLQTLFAENPKDDFLLYAIAKEYETLGEPQAALDFYAQLLAQNPDYVGVYYHLGKLQEKTVSEEAAVATYQTGMTVARRLGDQHALSELAGAKLNLVDDDDDY